MLNQSNYSRLMEPKPGPVNPYTKRLKAIWKCSFSAFGVSVYDGEVTRRNKILISAMALVQVIIFIHQLGSISYNFAFSSTISQLSFYAALLVSTFTSVSSMWTLFRRRITIARLLNKLTDQLSTKTQHSRKVLLATLVTFIGPFTLCIVESSCSILEIVTQNNTRMAVYAGVYLFGTRPSNRYLYIARIIISFEFFVVLLLSVEFVNISVSFFAHICHMIYFRFSLLNSKLERLLRSGRQLTSLDLQEYRKQHQLACEVTEELSEIWSPLGVFWLLGFILSLCFDLRALWIKGNATLFIIGYIADIGRQLWLIVVLFKTASNVNTEAHKLAETLVTLTVSQSAIENTHEDQLNHHFNYLLLTKRLVSTSVGINASGLFLLNASSFLSMAGTVMTYLIVLYQST